MRLEMARELGRVRQDASRNRWIIDLRPWGRITSIPVGPESKRMKMSTREMADTVLSMIRSDVTKGATVETAIAFYLPNSRQTLEVKLANWLEYMRDLVDAGERAPSYLRELERYAAPGGHFDELLPLTLAELRPARLQRWGQGLSKKGLAAKTRRNIVGALAACLHWLYDNEELARVPKLPSVSVPTYSPAIIAPASQDEILAQIPIEKRGIFIAQVEHALRPGEARAFDVSDYSWKDRMLTVAHGMDGPSASSKRRTTKTRDVMRFEASDALAAWLEEHVKAEARLLGDRPLFLHPTTEDRWTYWAQRAEWSAAGARMGLPNVRLYEGTKHSTLTALRSAGVEMDVIQRAARHKDRRTTERYAQLGDFAVVEALKKRSPRA